MDFGWLGSILLAFLTFVLTWIIGGRRIRRRLEPAMIQVKHQIEAGHAKSAIETLQAVLPLGNWMPLLKGHVLAQMGFLHYQIGERDKALAYLAKAGRRNGDAQLLLAAIWYRDGKKNEALQLLADCTPYNKKHLLLHNTHAWLLIRENRTPEAMARLSRLVAKSTDEASADNLLRLQNGQKLNMKPFGMQWYALGFEHPPASMGELRPARKGFRQQPKRRG